MKINSTLAHKHYPPEIFDASCIEELNKREQALSRQEWSGFWFGAFIASTFGLLFWIMVGLVIFTAMGGCR
jgi:hypothetical protein